MKLWWLYCSWKLDWYKTLISLNKNYSVLWNILIKFYNKCDLFNNCREFRLVLRQNPLSVFATDVHIENTDGPMDYDITRIYTGTLEGTFLSKDKLFQNIQIITRNPLSFILNLYQIIDKFILDLRAKYNLTLKRSSTRF